MKVMTDVDFLFLIVAVWQRKRVLACCTPRCRVHGPDRSFCAEGGSRSKIRNPSGPCQMSVKCPSNVRQIPSNVRQIPSNSVNFCLSFLGPSVKFCQTRQYVKTQAPLGPLLFRDRPRPLKTLVNPLPNGICFADTLPGRQRSITASSVYFREPRALRRPVGPPVKFRQITAARRAPCQIPSNSVKLRRRSGPPVKTVKSVKFRQILGPTRAPTTPL